MKCWLSKRTARHSVSTVVQLVEELAVGAAHVACIVCFKIRVYRAMALQNLLQGPLTCTCADADADVVLTLQVLVRSRAGDVAGAATA
jgi:hypothetical protein